jgi:HD-like signal output (HDOD) protein
LAQARAKEASSFAEAELALFQENHAAIGLWLAEKWHFPPNWWR